MSGIHSARKWVSIYRLLLSIGTKGMKCNVGLYIKILVLSYSPSMHLLLVIKIVMEVSKGCNLA